MPCGDSCFSLHLFSASSLTVSIPLPVFSVQVIASLPSLNPRRIFYGSTTREDDRGDEAAQLRIEDTEVLPGRDGRIGQALPPVPRSTGAGTDSRLWVALTRPRAIEQLAECGCFRAKVFLS